MKISFLTIQVILVLYKIHLLSNKNVRIKLGSNAHLLIYFMSNAGNVSVDVINAFVVWPTVLLTIF